MGKVNKYFKGVDKKILEIFYEKNNWLLFIFFMKIVSKFF